MKKTLICLFLTVAGILVSPGAVSYAEPSILSKTLTVQNPINLQQLPSIITEGFEILKSVDFSAALSTWLKKSSPFLQSNAPLMKGTLQGVVQDAVGKCIGYSAIDSWFVTENTQIVFIESQHEHGALFWSFTTYKSPRGWIISDFTLNTDPSEVLPPSIIFRRST